MKLHASFLSFSLNWLLNSLSKKYICIKIWSAPEKLSQFLASCSRLTIQTLWNAETMSFPTYSHPTLFFKFRSSLVIRSCYTLRVIALGSWHHLQDWGFSLPSTRRIHKPMIFSIILFFNWNYHRVRSSYSADRTLEIAIEDYICSLLLSRCGHGSSCYGKWSDGFMWCGDAESLQLLGRIEVFIFHANYLERI